MLFLGVLNVLFYPAEEFRPADAQGFTYLVQRSHGQTAFPALHKGNITTGKPGEIGKLALRQPGIGSSLFKYSGNSCV